MDLASGDIRGLYMGGQWRAGSSPVRHAVLAAPFSNHLYDIPEATTAEIDDAVAAAREGCETWRATAPAERARALRAIRQVAETRVDDIARAWATEAGMPVTSGRAATTALPFAAIDFYADLAETFEYEQILGKSRIVHDAAGVAVGITPWNYPFSQVATKAITALAAGCSIIVKPATGAPGCAYVFAEIVHEAGLPPGVFGLVTGSGRGVGDALVAHPGTDVVSFTGSTETGVGILRSAAAGVKRCTLELGGKSPYLLLEGAPVGDAVAWGMASCYRNNGQTCTALTRFLVPRSMMSEVTAAAAAYAEACVVGDPLDPATTLGPLMDAGQWASVQRYIGLGLEQGATLAAGGPGHPAGLEGGNFARPTVFTSVDRDSTIAREEIFGPVLAIVPYDSVDEAVAIANDSEYGLAAAVWGPDPDESLTVARRVSAGVVSVDGGAFNAVAPYGGLRRSGLGHELGEYGFREYLQIRVINT